MDTGEGDEFPGEAGGVRDRTRPLLGLSLGPNMALMDAMNCRRKVLAAVHVLVVRPVGPPDDDMRVSDGL